MEFLLNSCKLCIQLQNYVCLKQNLKASENLGFVQAVSGSASPSPQGTSALDYQRSPRARHFARVSFSLHTATTYPHFTEQKSGSERLSNLSEGTQLLQKKEPSLRPESI